MAVASGFVCPLEDTIEIMATLRTCPFNFSVNANILIHDTMYHNYIRKKIIEEKEKNIRRKTGQEESMKKHKYFKELVLI